MAERVKLYVWGVLYEMANAGAYALLLTDESGKRRLPIVIGLAEARTIAFILEGRRSRRPFTHELMKNTVAAFGGVLQEISIHRFDENIFYSELFFTLGNKSIRIDSRTSDAIALALMWRCPIYMHKDIFDAMSLKSEVYGKMASPSSVADYTEEELEELLRKAVEKEDYEKASEWRDILRMKRGENKDDEKN